eukprot:5053377-Amphidinium_carterae.1
MQSSAPPGEVFGGGISSSPVVRLHCMLFRISWSNQLVSVYHYFLTVYDGKTHSCMCIVPVVACKHATSEMLGVIAKISTMIDSISKCKQSDISRFRERNTFQSCRNQAVELHQTLDS